MELYASSAVSSTDDNCPMSSDEYHNLTLEHRYLTSNSPSRLLYFIFFLSGAAALIYEISWSRQIGLLFGYTVHAAAIVLGSYFAGMAIGYGIGGRYASRGSPLAAYGIAELIAAAWASLIPSILSGTESTPLLGWLINASPMIQTWLRAAYCFLLLLPATAALGATLPFIAEFLSPKTSASVGRVSLVYACNTAGAVVGVACATAFLLVTVGVRGSNYLAAGLSAVSGIVALFLSRPPWPDDDQEQSGFDDAPELCMGPLDTGASGDAPSFVTPDWLWWSMISGLCGFTTLALEVLYTRLFSLVFHNSTYTFGLVVAVFLVALALGATVVPILSRRVAGETWVGVAAWLSAVTITVSVIVFMRMTGLEYFKAGDSFRSYLVAGLTLVALVVLPPVTFLGVLLPLIWKSLPQSRGTGCLVGWLTMVNTLSAAVGSVVGGFLLLPAFGLWASFGVIVLVLSMIAGAAFVRRRQTGLALFGGLTCLPLIFLLGTGSESWIRPASMADEDLVRRWESSYGWIDVVRSRDDGVWKLRQNLHYRHGATGKHAIRERRLAHIPLLLHEHPRKVLFLGLGTGVTASGALPFEEIDQIEIVEMIPEVVDAARLLSQFNGNIVDHPKVEIRIDDARHDMIAKDRRYDVIVSDLFVPWESQTGYLYTVEHYQASRDSLKPGGLFCQWLPLYQMGTREFELIADSFASVFPETALWWGRLDSHGAILALIGSEDPIRVDLDRLRERFEVLHIDLPIPDPYLPEGKHLLDLYLGQWPDRASPQLNTDEHPRVEFLTPQSHRDRILLTGTTLRRYFDSMFAHLPEGLPVLGLQDGNPQATMKRRRAGQHLILFGE